MRQWLISLSCLEILDNAYVMELYDGALETRAEVTKSLFDTYTVMAYNPI